MNPLTPDDLLIRRSPQELDDALERGRLEQPTRSVPLERFQSLEHEIRENPLTSQPYLELAGYYLSSRRWSDARRVLEGACKRFPEEEQVQFLLEESQLARSLQLNSEAEQAHQLEPTQLTQNALEQTRLEMNVLREKVSRARLQRHPDQTQLNLPLATALHGLGQSNAAVEALRTAMVEPKLRSAAAYQLGQIYEELGRIPDALAAYRRSALFRVPQPSREHKIRALLAAADLAERSRLIDPARRYVGLLVELSPDDIGLKERQSKLCATPL